MKRLRRVGMTFINEGEWDRGIRLLAGVSLLAAGTFASGIAAVALVAVGAVALITGIAGWCPAYSVCGISTTTTRPTHCANCDPSD
jgi:DUF2892 family protein